MWEKGVAEALQPDPTRSLSCRAQGAPGAAGSGQAPGSVHACGIRGCEDGIPSLPMGCTWALTAEIAVNQRSIHFQGGFFFPLGCCPSSPGTSLRPHSPFPSRCLPVGHSGGISPRSHTAN